MLRPLISLVLLFCLAWAVVCILVGKPLPPKQALDIATSMTRLYGGTYALNPIANIFGYEYRCSDLHGGDKCRFIKRPRDHSTSQSRDDALSIFNCKTNDDCGVTQKGGCVLRGFAFETTKNDGHCVCVTGPVIYGCMPKDQVPKQ